MSKENNDPVIIQITLEFGSKFQKRWIMNSVKAILEGIRCFEGYHKKNKVTTSIMDINRI